MPLKHTVHSTLHRFGVDLVRYPLHDPVARTVQLMQHYRVGCVVDVGANDGGFGRAIRDLGYTGRIVSFEPLDAPFERLRRHCAHDPDWDAVQMAIGDTGGEVTVHISGNSGLSSSVLPMLPKHTEAAPKSRYVGAETVRQERLDKVLPRLGIGAESRAFLKLDVQGYERAALDGSRGVFESGAVLGLQLELSLVPLYHGAMTYREALERADELGLALMGLDPVFADPVSGRLLQADAVFLAA